MCSVDCGQEHLLLRNDGGLMQLKQRTIDTARLRLDVQRCRLLRRSIPAAPILNSYCGEWEVPEEVKNRLENEIDFGGRVVL